MSFWIVVTLATFGGFTLWRLIGGTRMSPTIIKEKLAAGAVILDVRSSEEFRSGAYRGAINIPLGDLGPRLGELAKDRPVVLYCASGGRSAMAAQILKQAGFSDVHNAGGLHQMPR